MEKVVSLNKARRELGALGSKLSDAQVIQIITSLNLLAREQLLYNGSKEKNNDPPTQSHTKTS